MFGKLFKYDFKSNYKWYCITFAILLSLYLDGIYNWQQLET